MSIFWVIYVCIFVTLGIECDNDYCEIIPNEGDVISVNNVNASVQVNCVDNGQCRNIVGYFNSYHTEIICEEYSCDSSRWIFGEKQYSRQQDITMTVSESDDIYIETNDMTVLTLRMTNPSNITINCNGIECNVYSNSIVYIKGSGIINCHGFSITNVCIDQSKPTIDEPLTGKCYTFAGMDNCGYKSNGDCYCDTTCIQRNDCCDDYIDTCNRITFSLILYATIVPILGIILLGIFAWCWVLINNKSSLKQKLLSIFNYNSTQRNNVELESINQPERVI